MRLSGADSKSIAEGCLKKRNGGGVKLSDHRAVMACFYCGDYFLDEVVALYFAAPHSYTGEDVVEISCHGSSYVQQRMLQHLTDSGVRLAERGEFTMRAFLSGRLDLSQAEAVADLIDSRSETSHSLAVSQLRGGYAKELESLRQQLIDLTAMLELELDFSDEDVEFANREHFKAVVSELQSKVSRLVGSFAVGNALKNGVPVAIVGRPNVGKSTLLNALLQEDRAIVSDIPGTTRDTIEELFNIDGIMFRLIDTAGIRNAENAVEKAGIERSVNAVRQARIVLYVVDATANPDGRDEQLTQLLDAVDMSDKTLILLRNKMELVDVLPSCMTENSMDISAKRGDNLDRLRSMMADAARKGTEEGMPLLTNVRHYEALKQLASALNDVRAGMESNLTSDLLVIDLRDALYHLGTITGKVSSEEVLSSIFSRFCIGK